MPGSGIPRLRPGCARSAGSDGQWPKAETIPLLHKAFQEAVDDYLQTCRDLDEKRPLRPLLREGADRIYKLIDAQTVFQISGA